MITLVATLKAKPGQEAALAEECIKIVKIVRATEKGCLMYIPHVADDNPAEIIFVEKFVDQDAFEQHFKTEHFQALAAKFDVLLDGPPVLKVLKELA